MQESQEVFQFVHAVILACDIDVQTESSAPFALDIPFENNAIFCSVVRNVFITQLLLDLTTARL